MTLREETSLKTQVCGKLMLTLTINKWDVKVWTIHVAEVRKWWQTVVNMILKLQVLQKKQRQEIS
jgi:hypothetical protein